jgi:hypothetical protein
MAKKRRLRKTAALENTTPAQQPEPTPTPEPIAVASETKEEAPKKARKLWSRNKSSEE